MPLGKSYDVCVYGGTSAGVVAAVSAARMGCSVLLLEPSGHLGGMTSGGLGFTDIGNEQVVTGIARQFYRKIGAHYGTFECLAFEPHVADSVFRTLASEKGITLVTGKRLVGVNVVRGRIISAEVADTGNGSCVDRVRAKEWIDCTYEGDLMAASGVSYVVGRESDSTYGETCNGVQMRDKHQFPDGVDPYSVKNDPGSGLLWGIDTIPDKSAKQGSGDSAVQAYNFRVCLTDSVENMIPIDRPEGYDPSRYRLLVRLIEAQPDKRDLGDYLYFGMLRNRKADINDNGAFSTDMIGYSRAYPEASYGDRKDIFRMHEEYTKGLLYFLGHDPEVPSGIRKQMLRWGYPKDEFVNDGHWPPQLYVREARRMSGGYVVTQSDCEGKVSVGDGIAMAAYAMDSHNCRRMVIVKDGKAMVKNEGDVQAGGYPPYRIPYRAIVPLREECVNLLVPVCLSASHIAYGSIRMEPVFMVLGQSAGMAAALAVEDRVGCVQDVGVAMIGDIISKDPYLDGTAPDVIVDDCDSAVKATSGWVLRKHAGCYGPTFRELGVGPQATPGPEECVRYEISVPKSGLYDIYAYQLRYIWNRSRYCTYRLWNGTEHKVTLDLGKLYFEGQTSGEWSRLGEFYFERDSVAVLTLSGEGIDGTVTADAILLTSKKE
ncbi:MAG: FAD-dependent oxidoreductase [Bacteroidales bacterium]|jgi:hypothetical protein|nr:FAD-dependent oxidoreductase [Bacteroidales bacterium]MCI2121761.1 FAD-dependent oxidoreductase [Bacteroidales bacterium]MCI2145902.1 FAD-dependent oxidoreductase [Bacteroidales bacterium]